MHFTRIFFLFVRTEWNNICIVNISYKYMLIIEEKKNNNFYAFAVLCAQYKIPAFFSIHLFNDFFLILLSLDMLNNLCLFVSLITNAHRKTDQTLVSRLKNRSVQTN